MICYRYKGHPPTQHCNVYPKIGLKGFWLLTPKLDTEIVKMTVFLSRISGSLPTLSNKRGAKVKLFAIVCRCDYFLKMVTGRDIVSSPPVRTIL